VSFFFPSLQDKKVNGNLKIRVINLFIVSFLNMLSWQFLDALSLIYDMCGKRSLIFWNLIVFVLR